MNQSFEVIIVGGSYAGLSAAMSLARAGRRVLLIDSGRPCNRQTPHAHNFITHDGDLPADISAQATGQVLAYPTVTLVKDTAIAAGGTDGAFTIRTAGGESFSAEKIILATGIRDLGLPIEGFAECWGISVLHCPYCHGYEVRNMPLGVIAGGETAFEFARLIHQWSSNLELFTNGPSGLAPAQRDKLAEKNIRLCEQPVAALEHEGGQLRALRLADGSRRPLQAVFARGAMEQHSDLWAQLGCALGTEGMGKGLVQTDDFGKTSVAGVYAAGDNASPMRALAAAIAAGSKAGAVLNHELIAAHF